jgi:hypothetical protein
MTIINYCIVELLALPSLSNPSPPPRALWMFILLLLLVVVVVAAVAVVIVADSYRIHCIHSLFCGDRIQSSSYRILFVGLLLFIFIIVW